jgi:hypothetical protein
MLVFQLTSALQAIHSAGLACRSLHPSKIILTGANRVIFFVDIIIVCCVVLCSLVCFRFVWEVVLRLQMFYSMITSVAMIAWTNSFLLDMMRLHHWLNYKEMILLHWQT